MLKSRKSWIALAVVIGLVGVSSVALAEHVDDHPEDTELSFAYDEDDHFLAVNISDNDTSLICDYGTDPLTGTYGDPDEDGNILIEELKDGDNDYEFEARPADQVGDDYDIEAGITPYDVEDGPCTVKGIEVAGPNGQINHGQFMKAAKSLFDTKGHGCVLRHFAQSNIGKGDTQLKTSDVDDEWGFDADEDGANLTFSYFETDCKHGKKDKGEEGQTQAVDRPRGKSADAPGKNK